MIDDRLRKAGSLPLGTPGDSVENDPGISDFANCGFEELEKLSVSDSRRQLGNKD